jgi:hypothetical protein
MARVTSSVWPAGLGYRAKGAGQDAARSGTKANISLLTIVTLSDIFRSNLAPASPDKMMPMDYPVHVVHALDHTLL